MTGNTCRQWIYVIGCRRPGLGAVANTTVRRGRNVVRRFTRRRGAVMTGATAARYFIVIHFYRRRPAFG